MTAHSAAITIEPVAVCHTPFADKLLIPRQPGLAPSLRSKIELLGDYNNAESLAGIEQHSHLWLLWRFHATADRGWKPTVRPPRLGGNKRVGVFASRSTHRPNAIGMSVVKLHGVLEPTAASGWSLEVSGLDTLDGTPVLDIKPYLPYSDAIAGAKSLLAGQEPEPYAVEISPECEQWLLQRPNATELRAVITELLAQGPRPAYHANKKATGDEEPRVYIAKLYDFELRWCFRAGVVVALMPVDSCPAKDGFLLSQE